MKYKVEYCEFVIVETDDAQKALEKVQNFVAEHKEYKLEDTERIFMNEQ